MRRRRLVAGLQAVLAACCLTQGMPASAAGNAFMPPAKTENGITYVSGGIGENQVAAMKRAASQYDLMLTFAEQTGAYLADVRILIKDAGGRVVLDTVADGPLFLARLPDGTYAVEVEQSGKKMSRTVHVVSPGHADVIFRWPAA